MNKTYGVGGTICAMYGCNNYRVQKNAKSFYSFPKSPLCKEWVLKTMRIDLYHTFEERGPECLKYMKVCDIHFKESDFRNPKNKSQGLKRGSIPSLHICVKPEPVVADNSMKKRPDTEDESPVRKKKKKISIHNINNVSYVNDENTGVGISQCSGDSITSKLQTALRKVQLARSRVCKIKKSIERLKHFG